MFGFLETFQSLSVFQDISQTALAGCCLTKDSVAKPPGSLKDAKRKLAFSRASPSWVYGLDAHTLLHTIKVDLGGSFDNKKRQTRGKSVACRDGPSEQRANGPSFASVSEWIFEAKRILDIVPQDSLLDVVRIDWSCTRASHAFS